VNGLLDTSVLIGPLTKGLPDELAISIVSLAELRLGVLLARDLATRSTRLARLVEAERAFSPIPVDDEVASAYASIVAAAREDGRKPKVMDALIAATAAAKDLTLYTWDRDFANLRHVRVKVLS
jgi:predicted nucleic acid-binding protein